MRKCIFYMSGDQVVYGSASGKDKDISDELLLGKDLFKMIYPEADIGDSLFDSLYVFRGKLKPKHHKEGQKIARCVVWSVERERWFGSWDDDL